MINGHAIAQRPSPALRGRDCFISLHNGNIDLDVAIYGAIYSGKRTGKRRQLPAHSRQNCSLKVNGVEPKGEAVANSPLDRLLGQLPSRKIYD